MFVALSGKKDSTKDKGTRKRLRAHVMHNFRDKATKSSQRRSSEEADRINHPQQKAPANAGQKLRFRLKDNGKLEESVPLRQRKKKTGQEKDDEPDVPVLTEKESEKGPALPSPNFEAWSRQYFGDQPDLQPDLQPDFQLPFLLPHYEKQQYRTLTEGYFDKDKSKNFWEDAEVTSTTTELTQIPLPTSPLVPFGISRLDPLNVLPFPLSRRDEEFIDRFQNWETDSWCPVNGRGIWFNFALKDELLFHATMYHWGMHFVRTNLDFHFRNPEIIEHKLASFHMINQRLSDNKGTVTDETLAAVAAIVNIEISFGSREEAKKHMNGLETMIDMKGGIEKIKGSIDGVLQRFIGWNDLNYAELFGSQLRFAKNCTYLNEPNSFGPEASCFRQSIHGVDYGPLIWDRLQGDVINILHEVRILCEEVNTRPFRGLQEAEKVSRSDSLHKIERKLCILTVIEKEDAILESSSDRMWRATALAGLMYVHHMLRFLPLVYRQFNTLSRDLQIAMALTGGSQGVWKNAPEILVWALTTGTIVSEGRMEHGWYVERLASACRDLGYSSWKRYREKMKSFLWVERLDDARYKKVWDQVELLL